MKKTKFTKFFEYVAVKYGITEKILPETWEVFEEFRLIDIQKKTPKKYE